MLQTVNTVEAIGRVPAFLVSGEPAAQIRVVAVGSDDYFREMLPNELSERGFAVTTYSDAQSVLAAGAALSAADLIVLDWGLAGGSGLDLMQQLRRQGVNLPIVFLTHRSLTSNESLALEHGAIDFIDKSRGISILAYRLRIVARIKVPESRRDKVLQFGRLMLKPHISRVFWNEVDVELTVGEFKIVNLLAGHVGQHVTYREIYDALHYRGFVAGCGENGYKTNVRSAIKRIRRKFEALDPVFDRIQNYTSFGYIWAQD
jgi:two-component system, OmpR family, response regulator ChvI